MGLLRLSTPGFDYQSQLTITQFVIPAGAGATFANANSATLGAGGVCTFTSNAAHGLTLNPSAGVPPNYFVTFGGSSSAITGTGVLINNIFRILSIPSTTTFTFWSTISTATVTSTTVIPVFFPNFIASPSSLYSGPQPTQTVSSVTTAYPPPSIESAYVYAQNGANCLIAINSDNKFSGPLDPLTTPSTGTPATAPTWTTALAASVSGAIEMMALTSAIWASGTTATSTYSVLN